MADEREELTPAQQVLGAALELNEATYELMSTAQTPDLLHRLLNSPGREVDPPFSEAMDKVCQAISNLHHAAGCPAAYAHLADAAERWVRGED